MSERLHKLLAQHGLGSRREIEKWMLEGRVRLNNQPAQPGDRYNPGDRVSIDGKDVTSRLRVFAAPKVILYHKPQGQPITPTAEDESGEVAEKSVMESLPSLRGSRWLVVNTMQAGDSGLLLLTSDGRIGRCACDAARKRRRQPTSRACSCRFPNTMSTRFLASFSTTTRPSSSKASSRRAARARIDGSAWNRIVRIDAPRCEHLFESRGLKVSRVIQVKFGEFELPRDLPRGKHRELSESEVAELYASVELALPTPPPKPEAAARPAAPGLAGQRRIGARSRSGADLRSNDRYFGSFIDHSTPNGSFSWP